MCIDSRWTFNYKRIKRIARNKTGLLISEEGNKRNDDSKSESVSNCIFLKKNKAQLENKSLYLELLREGHKEG